MISATQVLTRAVLADTTSHPRLRVIIRENKSFQEQLIQIRSFCESKILHRATVTNKLQSAVLQQMMNACKWNDLAREVIRQLHVAEEQPTRRPERPFADLGGKPPKVIHL